MATETQENSADSTQVRVDCALGAQELDAKLKEIIGTDGQEIDLYALTGAGCGFYARISGDCYIEAANHESPLQALLDAVQQYQALPCP